MNSGFAGVKKEHPLADEKEEVGEVDVLEREDEVFEGTDKGVPASGDWYVMRGFLREIELDVEIGEGRLKEGETMGNGWGRAASDFFRVIGHREPGTVIAVGSSTFIIFSSVLC